MKTHYDICVTGLWFGYNYGSLLTGYALYRLLKDSGKDVLMLSKPGASSDDPELLDGHNTRFIEKYYDREDISPVLPYERLGELNEICDCFIAGSNQGWNYQLSFNENMYLPFVDDDKKIISFASSFGHEEEKLPPGARGRIASYLKRFNAISVREDFDVDILEKNYGIAGTRVIDPVFCLEEKIYEEIASTSTFDACEPYMAAYILDPTPEKREAVLNYLKLSGLKPVIILDGNTEARENNVRTMDLPGILPDLEVEDFLKIMINAKFIITDAYQGAAFSVIFNKSFICIGNYSRGIGRFLDLFQRLDIKDRLLLNPQKIPMNAKFLQPIDYEVTNRIIRTERRRSVKWLRWAVETPVNDLIDVTIPECAVTFKFNKDKCTGCGACAAVCALEAVSMQTDEVGYYRPKIDYYKCVKCGRCRTVCPAISGSENKNTAKPDCYACSAADEQILYNSSSGGTFTLLAEEAFKRNGSVAGAAWRNDFKVEHIIIDDRSDMYKLQKAKYLQSYTGNIFCDIKNRLANDKFVLFSGTPCQIEGLKAYLGKEYDNLILIDIFCGYSPSAMFFQRYIEDEFPNGIKKYEFRNKSQGWNDDCISVTEGNSMIRRGGDEDIYQLVYHDHTMCPAHCENCKYQSFPRPGDISLGDFWGLPEKDPGTETGQGISIVLCNNEKGRRFFDSIPTDSFSVKKEIPFECIGDNVYVSGGNQNHCPPGRDDFYRAIRVMSFNNAADYALKREYGKSEDEDPYSEIWPKTAHYVKRICSFLKRSVRSGD